LIRDYFEEIEEKLKEKMKCRIISLKILFLMLGRYCEIFKGLKEIQDEI